MAAPLRVEVVDPDRMEALGRALGALLRTGDALCMTGPLGAGKTTLTRGIAVGLGVAGTVASPTFVIARRHRGARVDLVHADAYRLSPDDDFADVVPDPDDVVTVVEWGDSVMAAIVDSWLAIRIERSLGQSRDAAAPEDGRRSVTFVPVGPGWDDGRMEELGRAVVAAAG